MYKSVELGQLPTAENVFTVKTRNHEKSWPRYLSIRRSGAKPNDVIDLDVVAAGAEVEEGEQVAGGETLT